MPIQHVNRKGAVYYLHEDITTTGKPRYFTSTKKDGKLLDAVPDGFEFYEDPNAQVFCRKILPKHIADQEVKMVKAMMLRNAKTPYVIVDVRKKDIIVYAASNDMKERMAIMDRIGRADEAMLRFLEECLHYSPMFKFALVNEKSREFFAYRWCLLGSIDDWYLLESGSLATLLKKYARHLGAESFFFVLE